MEVEIVVALNLFPELAARLGTAIPAALTQATQVALDAADAVTRVRTGALKANKTIENDGQNVTVTWNQFYAIYQCEGTYKMTGTHFGEAGIDAAAPGFLAALTSALGV